VSSPFDAGPTEFIISRILNDALRGWSVTDVSIIPDGADPVAKFAAALRDIFDAEAHAAINYELPISAAVALTAAATWHSARKHVDSLMSVRAPK
jgi:hypothetical protein